MQTSSRKVASNGHSPFTYSTNYSGRCPNLKVVHLEREEEEIDDHVMKSERTVAAEETVRNAMSEMARRKTTDEIERRDQDLSQPARTFVSTWVSEPIVVLQRTAFSLYSKRPWARALRS
jgi:hypothetical protein